MTAKKKTDFLKVITWILRITKVILFAVLLFLFPAPNIYFQNVPTLNQDKAQAEISLPTPPPVPVNLNNLPLPLISAESFYIKDINSGMTIMARESGKLLFPASTTKLMTALVTLDKFAPEDIFVVRTLVDSGRVMDLVSGEKLTVESLLYGSLVHSANDAAYTLAENYPGGVESFVAAMNKKAALLHLSSTNFTNPVGFDDADNYSSAEDLAKLAIYALNNKFIKKIVSTKAITVSDISYTYFHDLTNVNELLGKVAGLSGVKSGYTQNAGEILISEVTKNDTRVLFVVLKSRDRFGDTEKLIDWVYRNFEWQSLNKITPATPV